MANILERDKLINYLPDFMKQFLEMKEVMNTEDIELNRIDSSVQDTLNNAFIADCNEYGIKKYEKLLGITALTVDTLDFRKTRVLVHWNRSIPYTYRVLVNKLNILCGVNDYDIVGDLENYSIDFNIYSTVNREEIEILLEKFLPQNISYNIYLTNQYLGVTHVGIVWQDDEIFELRQVVL